MIISKTPLRISLFGGGTDYPLWYRENGGAVLATTINKYCYITCRYLPQFFPHKHRIVYSRVETVNDVSEIKHPAIRAILQNFEEERGLEIHYDADLPAKTGVGSSSSFTVGFVNALKALRGEQIEKNALAKLAIHLEQNVMKENVGAQDQILAAYGNFNKIEFNPDDSFNVNPVILDRERIDSFQKHLMLCFTGMTRIASNIVVDQLDNIKNVQQNYKEIQKMVDEALSILQNQNTPVLEIGKLLHESWRLKRELSSTITNPKIDSIYQSGLDAGATGGKILGAGGGGFILFFAEPEIQPKIREKLKHLIQVPFKFESAGSKIVLYEPNGFI
ncbi:kinase [Candidatus Nitromaritima sp. SCGC AAA799-C22]|nr:kinase [Candidatus Nitromaritima sp. SCGC AAA799-C22]